MSTGQVETSSGDAPPFRVRSLQQGRLRAFTRKTTSLHHHDLLCTRKGGRDCMLMGSQERSEYVSEFLSTIDYVLIRPMSIARFLLTVCKVGGAIPLAPGSTRVTKKHMPALYPYWLYGLIAARQAQKRHLPHLGHSSPTKSQALPTR